jgi:hypothetical protein
MEKIKSKLIGGAMIDLMGWPIAQLEATSSEINLTIRMTGREYVFPESSILSVRKYVMIPFIGWGIRIRHTIPEYPRLIVFSYLGYPSTVLKFIRSAGFPSSKIGI